MASKVTIINQALNRIGLEPITDIDENVREARQGNLVYDIRRNLLMASYPWLFAKKRATLERLDDTPDFEYDYYYQLPDDCLKVRKLYNTTSHWEREGNKIAISDEDVYCKYTALVTGEDNWPPEFIAMLAADLAVELHPLSASSSVTKQILLEELKATLDLAKLMGAIEDDPDTGVDDDYPLQAEGR